MLGASPCLNGPRALQVPEVRAAGLLRLPVFASQREVELQHVNELLTEEPAERGSRIGFDHLLDLTANLFWIALGIGGPFLGNAIQLILGVLQADMRIETRARRHYHVGRDILQGRIGMLLTPHVEEDRLDIRTLINGLNYAGRFSV